MSNQALLFFFLFLAVQIFLPARRYLYALWYRVPVTHLLRYYTFSWTMRVRGISGAIRLRVFDKKSGKTLQVIDLEKTFFSAQVKYLLGSPRALLPIVKAVETQLAEKGLKHFGISAFMVVSTTHTEARELIDSSVDLTEEKIRLSGDYSWDLQDSP